MINRRNLITALTISPALTLSTVQGASASPSDPILPLYREWLDARAEWKRVSYLPGNENFDLPESVEADKRENAALAALVEATPTTLEGMAALIHVLWYFEDPIIGETDPEDPVKKAILGLWRATTGTAMPLGTPVSANTVSHLS